MVDVLTNAKEEIELPRYATKGAAGADVCSQVKVVILPGERTLIPTGLHFEIPEGYEIQVRPRSGLALKHGITVLNTPGTIDSDYRGELKILLINHGKEPFTVEPGMRIAQIVVSQVAQANFTRADSLAVSVRAEKGFGHTGV